MVRIKDKTRRPAKYQHTFENPLLPFTYIMQFNLKLTLAFVFVAFMSSVQALPVRLPLLSIHEPQLTSTPDTQ